MTVRTAVSKAQAVLNAHDSSIQVDGIWGAKTDASYVGAPQPIRLSVEKVVEAAGYDIVAVRASIVGKEKPFEGAKFDQLVAAAKAAGITGTSLVNFVATCYAESGLVSKSENGRYSLKGARAIFGSRLGGRNDSEIEALLRDGGESLFNVVYGPKAGLGNTQPGDGWKFRGRGYIQLTGRANYADFSKASGKDLVSNPDLALRDDVATDAAVWFWKKNVVGRGAQTNLTAATRVVRGGASSSEEMSRRVAFARNVASTVA